MQRSRSTIALVAAVLLTRTVAAQCPGAWLAGDGPPGTDGSVNTLVVTHTGELLAGGDFTQAGSSAARSVARWNGTSWSALGSGVNGNVKGLAEMHDGSMLAAGTFTGLVSRWSGSAWTSWSLAASGSAQALAELANGDVVVGGLFTATGTPAATNIARWDGSAWSALGSGTDGSVFTLLRLPNGDLIAGGAFTRAGGVTVNHVARWDGSAWSALGSGTNSNVTSLVLTSSGQIIASGGFTTAGGAPANHVALWNGSAWTPLGAGPPGGGVASIVQDPASGDVFATSSPLGSSDLAMVSRWNGVSWTALGTGFTKDFFGNSQVGTLVRLPSGHIVVGGRFGGGGGQAAMNIAEWSGAAWGSLGIGFNDGLLALAALPNGSVAAAGFFRGLGGQAANLVAIRGPTGWTPLGLGVSGVWTSNPLAVRSLAALPNGNLLVGGEFQYAGGVRVNSIARWDGAAWHALGSGFEPDLYANSTVSAILPLPNGDIIAAGTFVSAGSVPASAIARWDGSVWTPLGSGIIGGVDLHGRVYALAVLADGSVVAGGDINTAGGVAVRNIARWDGAGWHALAQGIGLAPGYGGYFPTVRSLAVLPNGDLVAGGEFNEAGTTIVNNIARWDGTMWWPMGSGTTDIFGSGYRQTVWSLLTLPSGDLMVGGTFRRAGGVSANSIARWRNGVWSPLGTGVRSGSGTATVSAIATRPGGGLLVGGGFTFAGPGVVNEFAEWTTQGLCAADFNCSGGLDVGDIFEFVNGWFASDLRADANGNNAIEVTDIFDFLNQWFAGC